MVCIRALLLFIVVFFSSIPYLKSQVDEINPTSDFIFEGNHFIPGSPWIVVGTGYGKNFSENMNEPNFLVDFYYQFKKKKQAIGFGYLTSRDQFLVDGDSGLFVPNHYVRHSTNSLHAMYGFRYEYRLRHNLAAFAGPAFNWGYRYSYTDSNGYDYHEAYNEFGLYAHLQYSFKIFYDLGVGASFWASYCESYQVIGFSFHLYLSSAFKRKVN